MKKSSIKASPKKKSSNKAVLKKVEQPEIITSPIPEVQTNPIVSVKCRRGSDKISEGQSCSSLTAENMTINGSSIARFRCVKCNFSWGVPTGGTFLT